MAYGEGITIKEMIDGIEGGEYVLPSIQREFKWSMEQIEALFNSLMCDYPINTFLFWEIKKKNVRKFQFYKFLQKFRQVKGVHNSKTQLSGAKKVIAVLDGQQRMTALYLSLIGSYEKKRPYARKDSPSSYIERKLYMDLLKDFDDDEGDTANKDYGFKFFEQGEDNNKNTKGNCLWFECGKALNFEGSVEECLENHSSVDMSNLTAKNRKKACKNLANFFDIIHNKKIINYYVEKSEKLGKALQIFIRTNGGGTALNYSDLLFSIATAEWSDGTAREIINEFVDNIYVKFGFNISKDNVLKACLVLCDGDVKFKVDNFTRDKVVQIESEWEKISQAVWNTAELIKGLGYDDKTLTAKNAIIPIAYYLYKNDTQGSILRSNHHAQSVKNIKEWLARVLLSGFFGGTADSVFSPLRDIINDNKGEFPIQQIIKYYEGKNKSISFTESRVENLLDLKYGDKKTYSLLSLLNSGSIDTDEYHQDHIHPQNFFNTGNSLFHEGSALKEQFYNFYYKKDTIPNLQLLPGKRNLEKSEKSLKEWLDETRPDKRDRDSFLREHHIDLAQSLEFENFLNFYEARKKKIKTKLMQVLGVKPDSIEDEAA